MKRIETRRPRSRAKSRFAVAVAFAAAGLVQPRSVIDGDAQPWGVRECVAGTPAPSASAAAERQPGADEATERRVPLPEIPKLAPLSHPPPEPAAVKELDGRLADLLETRLTGPLDPAFDVSRLTKELGPDMVPAIAQRIQELRERLDGGAAEALLEKARKAGRKALDKDKRGKPKKRAADRAEAAEDGDWLAFVLSLGRTEDDAWQDVVQLYGMLRMLEAVGTTPAVRQMIDCYSYFGELVRIDVQRSIARLGDKSVAALIEARKHDTAKVARWANRMLDELGRAIPGEAVSSTDPEVLADVVRAFGRTRDVDAVRVILSFCSSDRVGLRSAAREAVGAIGEPASWQLREAYQQLTGEKPPRSWEWDRLARELFRLHDQARLAEVYRLADEGIRELADGRFARAAAAFDQVLARPPLFDSRADMAPAYVGLARELEGQSQRPAALAALRKALRLRPEHPDNPKIESRIAYLEALDLIDAGTPDRFLIERAIELDPTNEDARALLGSLEERAVKKQSRTQRYVGAAAIALVAVVGMVVVALWPRRRKRPSASTPTKTPFLKPESKPAPFSSGAPTVEPWSEGEPASDGEAVPSSGAALTVEPPSSSAPTMEPSSMPRSGGASTVEPPSEPVDSASPTIDPETVRGRDGSS
jgi:HEAT repeat protein